MIVQESEYDEHGNIMKNTNAEFQPLGFAGGLYDADTKFVRFGARDYDPTIGRWTTKDPIGFAGGDTNLYAYVGGDPMSYVDPTGLWKNPLTIEKEAKDETKKSGLPGTHNGQADAFRHCVATCMMTQENGRTIALLFTEAVEKKGDWREIPQPPGEKCMDRKNNAVGAALGSNQGTNCPNACLEAVKNGTLTTEPLTNSDGYN